MYRSLKDIIIRFGFCIGTFQSLHPKSPLNRPETTIMESVLFVVVKTLCVSWLILNFAHFPSFLSLKTCRIPLSFIIGIFKCVGILTLSLPKHAHAGQKRRLLGSILDPFVNTFPDSLLIQYSASYPSSTPLETCRICEPFVTDVSFWVGTFRLSTFSESKPFPQKWGFCAAEFSELTTSCYHHHLPLIWWFFLFPGDARVPWGR